MNIVYRGMERNMNSTISDRFFFAIRACLIVCLAAFSSFSIADDSNLNHNLKQYISDSMNQLLIKLEENKKGYINDPELFFNDINIELSKVIDFKRIALKVMGKNVRVASAEQRVKFIEIFKNTLFETYASVLLDSADVEISVLNASINSRNKDKANVNIVINGSGGASYDVTYALHKGKDSIYRVENIIVMGINLGLAYKDRFQELVVVHKGNIDLVISNWSFKKTS